MKTKTIQEWEGVVDKIEGDTVYVQLVDITAGDTQANEIAEMPLSQFIKPGAIFRWRIVRNENNEVVSNIELRQGKFKQEE